MLDILETPLTALHVFAAVVLILIILIQPGKSGEIKAMVGGYDFDESKFNRSTQALRQTGSSFKPFVYTAAVDNGLRPEDTILDAPVTFGISGITLINETPQLPGVGEDPKAVNEAVVREKIDDSRKLRKCDNWTYII